MDPEVPLVVSEVNPDAIAQHKGIVANPNCTTMQMVVALKPLHDAAGLERDLVSLLSVVSGRACKAIRELQDQTHAILHECEPSAAGVYPHQIAFNVLPQVETFKDGDDYTTEERKVMAETARSSAMPELRITATCARVPVLIGHSESVNLQTREDLSPERARELLAAAPGVQVLDDPAAGAIRWPSTARPGRRVRRADPPRPSNRAHAQPLDRRRQPAQGRRAQRGAARRAAARARADRRRRQPRGVAPLTAAPRAPG